MHNAKINVCSLCVGFLLTLDEDFVCKHCSDRHNFKCPLQNDLLCKEAISEFDSFIEVQTKLVKSLINNQIITLGETITLHYEISSKLLNNPNYFKI